MQSFCDPPAYQEPSSMHLVKLSLLRLPHWFTEISSSMLLFALVLHVSPTLCALSVLVSLLLTLYQVVLL